MLGRRLSHYEILDRIGEGGTQIWKVPPQGGEAQQIRGGSADRSTRISFIVCAAHSRVHHCVSELRRGAAPHSPEARAVRRPWPRRLAEWTHAAVWTDGRFQRRPAARLKRPVAMKRRSHWGVLEDDNLEVVRSAYAAFVRRDLEGILALLVQRCPGVRPVRRISALVEEFRRAHARTQA